MHDVDAETLAHFRRRFAAVDAEIPAAPSLVRPRPGVTIRPGRPWAAAAAIVIVMGVLFLVGPLLQRSIGPGPSGTTAPAPSTSAHVAPVVTCGRIAPGPCATAIDLVNAFEPDATLAATWIRVDASCAPSSLCESAAAFDAVVVVGTGEERAAPWRAYSVTGGDGPSTVRRIDRVPAHMGIAEAPPSPSLAPLVSPIPFGDWLLSCPDIAVSDCTGAAERFVELMARDAAYVRGLTDGVLSVVTRPICPAVPQGADGSTCWEVTAPEGWPLGGDWCMVFARPTDQGEPPFVHVGGPTGTDSAEPAPSAWPKCAEPAVGQPLVACGRIGTVECDSAIAMVAVFDASTMVGATWIRMDDTCPEPAVCDRRWPFDAVVVVGSGPERQQPWTAFHVYGERGPEGVERWVTPLPAHMGIASVPIRLSDDAVKRVVNDYGGDHASDWGGMYIDQDRGGIIVALFSDDLERHRAALSALAGPNARLEIRGVEFSYAELKELSESLCREAAWFATIPAVLQGCGGVDQSANRIVVGVSTANPDAVRMIEEHFDLAGKIIVEVDGTGAALLPRGTLRITAIDGGGRPLEGLQCSPVPDIGTGPEGLGPLTDAAGVCVVDLPATGAWVVLVADPGPGERTVAVERVVVQPDGTTDIEIVVP